MTDHLDVCPPDYDLPLIWNRTSMMNKQYMYGLTQGASYSFYITDMVSVWVDAPTSEGIYKIALDRGITGFDEEKLEILKANLKAAINEVPSVISFLSCTSSRISAEVEISDNLLWPVNASSCDAESSMKFFRSLCCQSFSNQGMLSYKRNELENLLRVRAEYTLYLEENYKTVNGTELMDKYRRQHPEAAQLLQRYSRNDFESRVEAQYPEHLQKPFMGPKETRIWRDVREMTTHQKGWSQRCQKISDAAAKAADLQPKQQETEDTAEKKRRRSLEEDDQKRSLKPKLEPTDEAVVVKGESPSPSKRISPSKRKRLGLPGRR